jgi:hypothetical protein
MLDVLRMPHNSHRLQNSPNPAHWLTERCMQNAEKLHAKCNRRHRTFRILARFEGALDMEQEHARLEQAGTTTA